MKKYIELSLYQLRKKTNILSIIIISIAFFLIILLGSYSKSLNKDSNFKLSHYDKTFMVYKYVQDSSKEYITSDERKNIIKELESLKYVTMVTPGYAFKEDIPSENIKFKNEDFWFQVYAATNKSLPKIVKGTNFPDNDGYYMVCPENYYPTYSSKKDNTITKGDDTPRLNLKINKNDKMPENDYFNKTVKYKYFNNTNINKQYEMDIKIIGLYENSKYGVDEETCYVNTKVLEDINQNKYEGDVFEDGINRLNYYTYQMVEIDNYEHLSEFKEILKNNNFGLHHLSEVNLEYLNQTNKIVRTISIIIVVISFILLIALLNDNYNSDKNYYKLLMYLGYTEKEVKKIYLIGTIIKLLFCILIAFLIAIILVFAVKLILIYYPFLLWKWHIIYSFESAILIIMVSIIAVIVTSILNFKKIKVK